MSNHRHAAPGVSDLVGPDDVVLEVGPDRRQLSVVAPGRQVVATVTAAREDVVVHFEVAPGHIASGARISVVDSVFGYPPLRRAQRIIAATPAGDPELLAAVRRHLCHAQVHSAGSTCLIESERSDHDHDHE